jgi:hypothetical protein
LYFGFWVFNQVIAYRDKKVVNRVRFVRRFNNTGWGAYF